MMLQKMEELQRDTLSALNLAHGTTSTDSAPASRNPSTSSSMGSARDRSNSNSNRNNSCYATTLALGVLLALLVHQYKYCSYKSTNTATTAAPRQRSRARCITSALLKVQILTSKARGWVLSLSFTGTKVQILTHTRLALVDRTKSLASQISAVKDQNTSAAIQAYTHTHTHTHGYFLYWYIRTKPDT